MAGTLRLSNTGTGNGQSTITTAASGDTTYTLPSGGGTFVTTSSTEALTVPFASGTVSAPSVTFLGDTNTGIYSPGADQVAISTSGTAALTVDSNQRILVGTSTSFGSDNELQVKGIAAAIYRDNSSNATNAPFLNLHRSRGGIVSDGDRLGGINFFGDDGTDLLSQGANIYAEVDGTPGANDMPGRLVFSTTADGAADPTERMRIDSSGAVRIGSAGTFGANDRLLVYESDATKGTVVSVENASLGDGKAVFFDVTANTAGGSERRAYIAVQKQAGQTNCVAAIAMAPQDGQYNYIWVDDANQLRISTSNNNVGTTGGTVVGTQTSDERLKNILGPVTYGLNTVKQIEPVRYTLKDEPDVEKIGFIAQQVLPVVPESVFDTKQEIEGGKEGDPTQLGMEYVSLIPVLVNAIKELSAEVDALKAQLP